MDDLRYRSQQPGRSNGSRLPAPGLSQVSQVSSLDPRSNLPRRFTTDSGRVPTLSSLASPPRLPDPNQDYQAMHKVQLIEKKKAEYERIREQRRRFELEMQKLDQQQRQEAIELAQMEEEMSRLGHQSEPTTPPEYRENSGFPSMFSRPNRYSMSSLTSPPGLFNRPGRSGSQLASPQSGIMQSRSGFEDAMNLQMPFRSTPATRRNSDDEKEEAVRQDPSSHRSSNATNRYSMPVTRSRSGLYDAGLDQTNTTRFLFGDEEPHSLGFGTVPDETFPTLVRRDDHILSASSAALDLALSPSPNPESSSRGWSRVVNRHRPQQSMSSINGGASQGNDILGINSRSAALRRSLDLKYISENVAESGNAIMSPQANQNRTTPPKLQSSFSSNDIPTVKNPGGPSLVSPNANNHAQQHFHNHNASLGRIPAGAVPRGHTRELSNDNANANREQAAAYPSIQSALQASAAPFGPSVAAAAPQSSSMASGMASSQNVQAYNGFYQPNGYANNQGTHPPAAYNVSMLSGAMQQMNVTNGVNGTAGYPPQNYAGYNAAPYNQGSQPRDSQARVIQHRRQDNEAMSRYQNMPLESYRGQIYELCKDQHGCRYLQKKLDDRDPAQVHMIWAETNEHVIELMTDPFGNYLCQKLLEFCNDDERTTLIENASKDMVRIALNQHGTRALQKMIEFVNTPKQILLIIDALRYRVVELIQDLNGNHVIQKCLNKLSSQDAQFIFDAVGNNCVEVGTHRHGCCVLQRCIDHASGDQKLWLIQRITQNARILVQDPFGNYVVQYIIDLNDPTFTEPLVSMFKGCISQLSRHKFSSNVIEKCLRCAQPPSKDLIVEEMLNPSEMERMLRDSFANYVIQTALEYATPSQKYRLVEAIRPMLPAIRNTPYGRRIQAKVSAYDNRGSAASSGQATPADNTQGQIPLRHSHSRGMSGNGSVLQSNGTTNGANLNTRQNIASYPSSSVLTVPATSAGGPVQQTQFLSRAPGNFSPTGPAINGNLAEMGGPVQQPQYPLGGNLTPPRSAVNGNADESGEAHWL